MSLHGRLERLLIEHGSQFQRFALAVDVLYHHMSGLDGIKLPRPLAAQFLFYLLGQVPVEIFTSQYRATVGWMMAKDRGSRLCF